MLRRGCNNSSVACFLRNTQKRFSAGPVKDYDHSHVFTRALTEAETAGLNAQKHRTVSGVVPGKLFMRHWIAGEQAAVSIVNRTLSIAVTAGLGLWAAFDYNKGCTHYSAIHLMIYTFAAVFLVIHVHKVQIYGLFLLPYLIYALR